MTNNKNKLIAVIIFIALLLLFNWFTKSKAPQTNARPGIIQPEIGDVLLTVTTIGIIEPQNRLQIKPSISGRIETILVREGDKVETGDILAWMSSTERAALLDAARSQGEDAVRYWEEAYKKTPIISPIDGEVIVRGVEPGQTVSTSDVILVLSDRLVIKAQFDETDIGKVRLGQKAFITLDAYPDVKIEGKVDHIAYESEIVNNVTIYEVDVLPAEIPDVMRSGMSVTVEVVEKSASGVITIPSSAVHFEGKRQYVLVREGRGNKIVQRDVGVGLNNDKTAEIISGLTVDDKVIIQESSFLPKMKSSGTNPFMPSRRKSDDKSK